MWGQVTSIKEAEELVLVYLKFYPQSGKFDIMKGLGISERQFTKGIKQPRKDRKIFSEKRGRFVYYSLAKFATENNLKSFVSMAPAAAEIERGRMTTFSTPEKEVGRLQRMFDSLSVAR